MAETLTIRTSASTDVIKVVERGPQGPIGPQGPAGEGGGASTWDELTGKPSTFAPSAHTHTTKEILEARQTFNITSTNSASPTSADAQSAFQNADGSIDCVVVLNNTTGIVYANVVIPELTGSPSQSGRVVLRATKSGLGDITNFRLEMEGSTIYPPSGYDELATDQDLVLIWRGDHWNFEIISNASAPIRVNGPSTAGTLGLSEPADDIFRVTGSADATKKVAFEVDGLTTTTTRTLTVPDASGTIALNETFAAPPSIGNTTPAAGSFTTLNATGTTELVNGGTTAGPFRVYNTFTSATNFERLNLRWASNVAIIGTEKGSAGGTARPLELQTDGVTRLSITTGGNVGIRTSAPTQPLQIAGNCDQDAIGPLLITPSSTPNQIGCALTLGAGNLSGARNYSFISTGNEASGGAGHFAVYSGGYVFRCNSNGQYIAGFNTYSFLGQISCYPFNASTKGLVVRGFASQTANLFECQNSAASVLASISSAGAGVLASLTLNGNLTLSAYNLVTDTTTGTKIGTATNQKIGFFDKTPVVQQAAIADATDAATTQARLNDLLATMRAFGLIAT